MYCLRSDSSFESRPPEAPGSLPLISPTVDLLHEHLDIKEAEKHDLMESLKLVRKTMAAWAGDWDKTDPRLSLAKGAVNILAEHKVKVFGIIAGHDVLSPEARAFCQTEKWMETRVSIESMEDRTLYIHEEGGKKY
jgi:acetyl esterase/lipase